MECGACTAHGRTLAPVMGATPQLEEAVDGLDLFAMHDIRDGDGAAFVHPTHSCSSIGAPSGHACTDPDLQRCGWRLRDRVVRTGLRSSRHSRSPDA